MTNNNNRADCLECGKEATHVELHYPMHPEKKRINHFCEGHAPEGAEEL